jgi:hypothetical protein
MLASVGLTGGPPERLAFGLIGLVLLGRFFVLGLDRLAATGAATCVVLLAAHVASGAADHADATASATAGRHAVE